MSVVDQSANHKEQTPLASQAKDLGLPERLWTYDDFRALEAMSADSAPGLTSLAFIRAAIRRRARFCWVMALVGLLIALGVYHEKPPAYQASTTVLVTYGPYENVVMAPADDQAIAQSRTVAELAMRKLGLTQSVGSFLAAYTATPVSNRVLVITVNAPSSSEAVSRANAVAAAFLKFRDGQLEAEQNTAFAALDQQLNAARQKVRSLSREITQALAQGTSPGQPDTLSRLRAERSQAAAAVSRLEQTATGSPTRTDTTLAVKGSMVLDAAVPLPHSRLKGPIFYALVGLILGLVLGVGIAVIRALVSDRLRRRDDVAHALGAPVKLSVGTVRRSRWLPGRRGRADPDDPRIRRIARHLGTVISADAHGTAALAVVPVDDPQVATVSLVSLAVSCAQEGRKVIVADLCPDSPAARLLGADEPGVHTVSVQDAHLIVTVPDRDDVAPAGPLAAGSRQGQPDPSAAPLAAAWASANLLLTLVSLDPRVGAEHLHGWADSAVAFVTAGESSATRIHAVGEMIRLAGMTLDSAVLTGADPTDESLGMAYAPGAQHQPDRV